VLADDYHKRVVIVDTSNEIGGFPLTPTPPLPCCTIRTDSAGMCPTNRGKLLRFDPRVALTSLGGVLPIRILPEGHSDCRR